MANEPEWVRNEVNAYLIRIHNALVATPEQDRRDAVNALLRSMDQFIQDRGWSRPAYWAADPATVAVPEPESGPGRPDWRTEWWRAHALLLASLYFTLITAAEFELPGELLTKLEAHLVVALSIWGYFAERNRRNNG